MARKSYRTLDDVEKWVGNQGYGLERQTAEGLKPWGFRSTLGRHYVDAATGKVREIDLVSDARLTSRVEALAIIECKHSGPGGGAWIARESKLRLAECGWVPIMSPAMADSFVADAEFLTRAFPLGRGPYDEEHVAFAVVEATDESNDVAYGAMSQAMDGSVGWARDHSGLALCVPVVVMEVPLFVLYHAEGGDESLVEVPWRRILWGSAAGQTIVDVVRKDGLLEYGKALRWSFDRVAQVVQMQDWRQAEA